MKILYTFVDYIFAIKAQWLAIINRQPPIEWLTTNNTKGDIVLIPGLYEHWSILKSLGDLLVKNGFRVHIVMAIKRNRETIPAEAQKLKSYLVGNNLKNTTIVAHSKGGLVGLYYLLHLNADKSIGKVIAIATPFSGSSIGLNLKLQGVMELSPDSAIILDLNKHADKKLDLVSIYPSYDNHVWHKNGSFYRGAKNIKCEARGHHKILYDRKCQQIVLNEAGMTI